MLPAFDFLVTGANGQLGRAVLARCAARGLSAIGAGHADLAVEDRDAVQRFVGANRVRHVLHCGAWTNVDGCEADPQRADLVNGTGTANLAAAAAAIGASLLYVSTDFVFDGGANTPYAVDAPVAPLSAYGRSKLLGEKAVLAHDRPDFRIVRTSWVFGPGGRNFPRAILERARSGQPLAVVTDQVGRPTMTEDLADAMLDLCLLEAPAGIYHAANEGECSWHRFACDVLRAAGYGDVDVATTTAARLARPAARPAYSVLDTSRLDEVRGRHLPHYLDAVRRYLDQEADLVRGKP